MAFVYKYVTLYNLNTFVTGDPLTTTHSKDCWGFLCNKPTADSAIYGKKGFSLDWSLSLLGNYLLPSLDYGPICRLCCQ